MVRVNENTKLVISKLNIISFSKFFSSIEFKIFNPSLILIAPIK